MQLVRVLPKCSVSLRFFISLWDVLGELLLVGTTYAFNWPREMSTSRVCVDASFKLY
jgi:hypothetical protein